MATLLESGNTRERLIAAGADVHHVLAVRDAERNETATQQHAPAIKHARASQSSRTQYHDTRAVFKGGLRVQPPPPGKLRRKFFGNVKKHAQRNASADALYVCTIVMPGKAIWRWRL